MRTVKFCEEDQLKLRTLSKNSKEVNGEIDVSADGKVKKINYKEGQMMDPCYTGCLLNFHTHPHDYVSLYPDHPSATDFKYIFNATCKTKELSAHLVVTPKFLYVIYYQCKSPIMQFVDFFFMNYRIQTSFDKISKIWDRGTENFRQDYLKKMSNMGFHIDRFPWGSNIIFQIPDKKKGIQRIFIYILVIMCIFFIKKYVVG